MTRKAKVLAVDLDGTILHNEYPYLGAPVDGMKEELEAINQAGWKISVWTVRNNVDDVRKHLIAAGIPYDYINENPYGPVGGNTRKIYADVYLDDKAIQFNGETRGLAKKVVEFKEWHKRPIFGGDHGE